MADQIWSNCADVEIVSSGTDAEPAPTPEPEPESEPEGEPEPAVTCVDIVGDVPDALPAAWLPDWAGGDPITCDTLAKLGHPSLQYCDYDTVKKACCFCGGGATSAGSGSSPAQEPTPEPSQEGAACLADHQNLRSGNFAHYTCET